MDQKRNLYESVINSVSDSIRACINANNLAAYIQMVDGKIRDKEGYEAITKCFVPVGPSGLIHHPPSDYAWIDYDAEKAVVYVKGMNVGEGEEFQMADPNYVIKATVRVLNMFSKYFGTIGVHSTSVKLSRESQHLMGLIS